MSVLNDDEWQLSNDVVTQFSRHIHDDIGLIIATRRLHSERLRPSLIQRYVQLLGRVGRSH